MVTQPYTNANRTESRQASDVHKGGLRGQAGNAFDISIMLSVV